MGETLMTYCSTLTDMQVANVLAKEKSRKEQGGDLSLYCEAREELARRGLDPDHIEKTVIWSHVG